MRLKGTFEKMDGKNKIGRWRDKSLPVTECLPEIIAAVNASIPVVLKAPPGAGKTTGVPPALLREHAAGSGKILLVQPRRLAARAAAARLAHLLDSRLGDEVGYHVRFDKCTSSSTRLIAMTTGILLRRLQHDPLLENVSCVILDEFHERSLEIDLALGMLHRIRTTLRPELKLIVMSATLSPEPIVAFLGDAKAIESDGHSYPVDIRYTKDPSRDWIDQQVASILPEALRSTPGHLLVFLPGVGEIHRTRRTLESMRLPADCVINELYGDLSPQDQDAVLAESPFRKIILATNVAETSITIPGVTGVIDSGLARVMRFDPHVGLPKLEREPISQASAEQRAGRAGRTSPGICFRLWPAVSHHARRERDTPEIQRGDFSAALLTLAAWGERDVFEFPWLTPPSQDAVINAERLLCRLDAIDAKGCLTEVGHQMAALPLHPRMSRLMVEAKRLRIVDEASIAVALLTERDPFQKESQRSPSQVKARHQCDVVDRIERLKSADRRQQTGIAHILRVAKQIEQMTSSLSVSRPSTVDENAYERLKRTLLAAYPDRVARRRMGSDHRGVMVGGKGVVLDVSSQVRSGELFLCIDVDSAGTEARVRMASLVDQEWLHAALIRDVDEPFFNPTLKAVVARRRRYYDDLLLAESPIACQPTAEVAELLFRHAKQSFDAVFPAKDTHVQSLISRVQFINRHMPELGLPGLGNDDIEELLRSLCEGRTSIAELRSAPWLDHIRSRYEYEQMQVIDKQAPARMTLPSGNSAEVRYAEGKPPILEARIQELFGWKQTPRVAGGRIAVQLHLLGPNYRPQQITEDLGNFWKVTYAEIRKELKRRYPKHHWPEEPASATSTRNAMKPRE